MKYQKVAEQLELEYTKSTHAGHDIGIVDKGFMAGFAACLDVINSKKPESGEQKEPQIYHVDTCMGNVNTVFGHPLTFLNEKEIIELDSIGYSGKTSDGVTITRSEYLNSLNKGKFSVEQTKFDNGEFCESFVIARIK